MIRLPRHVARILAVLVLLLAIQTPAWAGDTEDCVNAKTNPTQAVAACRRLAEQGDAFAEFRLGDMYDRGHGVPQDYVQAHMWFNLAAAQGNEDAAKSRDEIATRMTPDDILEAQQLAREWLAKHQ